MSFIIEMLTRSMKCPSIAVGAVWPSLLQTVKGDTRKAGKGHGKTNNDKKGKVSNMQYSATDGEKDAKHSLRIMSKTMVSFKRAVCKWQM